MACPSILAQLLAKRFHISRAVIERKIELMEKAREALKNAVRSLKRDGHRVSLLRDGLLIWGSQVWLVHLAEEADSLLITELKAKYSPSELFLICWNAKESLIESARKGELHLAVLSRNQVIHGETDLSHTVMKFLTDCGLNLEKFRSLIESEDPLEEETALLMELLTLREMYNRMVMESVDERILQLLDELEEMAERGAEESEMNELLIAILEAYPVSVDEVVSGRPGKPDVVAYSPLWMLFELKNESATRSHVDQLKGYMDNFAGSASSPLGIPWKGMLVAPSVPPDVYAYALSRGVRVATWNALIEFLRSAFTRAVPIQLLRAAMEYEDVERGMSELASTWLRDFSKRMNVLKAIWEIGGATSGELAKELASYDLSGMEELKSILRELSGPVLWLIREEGNLITAQDGDPFPRIRRAILHLRRELYGR